MILSVRLRRLFPPSTQGSLRKMRRSLTLFWAGILGGLLVFTPLALAAPVPAQGAAELAPKIQEAEKNQAEIMKQIEEIKQELAVVKIRATLKGRPASP